MMGPLSAAGANGKHYSFLAFAAAGPAAGWLERAPAPDAESFTAMEALSNAWLRRYPRPAAARLGNGAELKPASEAMRGSFHMKKKPAAPCC